MAGQCFKPQAFPVPSNPAMAGQCFKPQPQAFPVHPRDVGAVFQAAFAGFSRPIPVMSGQCIKPRSIPVMSGQCFKPPPRAFPGYPRDFGAVFQAAAASAGFSLHLYYRISITLVLRDKGYFGENSHFPPQIPPVQASFAPFCALAPLCLRPRHYFAPALIACARAIACAHIARILTTIPPPRAACQLKTG